MAKNHFDLFIIGAGSGGVRAARLAAGLGAKVAIAEEFRYGGTCVIRGCVPKKLMVNAADYNDAFVDSCGFGWKVGGVEFSWEKFVQAKDYEIDRLENIYYNNLKNSDVKNFRLRAKLLSPNEIKLADGTVCSSKIILIATGGRPFIPNFDGNQHAITSNEVFNLKNIPNRIVILGGGYIASEFSGIFNGMGVNVTQIYRGETLLRGFDSDIREHVTNSMLKRGIDVRCKLELKKCEKDKEGLIIHFSDGSRVKSDCVLVAAGRRPNTTNLGLEEVGVKLNSDGAICVNDLQQTSVASIYAVGDVTNRLNLTPVAIRDAVAFVETVINGNPSSPDHTLVPTAIFTRPEVGTVGLTEEQARAKQSIKVYKTKFKPLANLISGRDEKTIMKLVIDESTRKILGCHLVGPNSAELIQLAAVAIKMGATKEDFDKTCAVHPTAAEELVTLN